MKEILVKKWCRSGPFCNFAPPHTNRLANVVNEAENLYRLYGFCFCFSLICSNLIMNLLIIPNS